MTMRLRFLLVSLSVHSSGLKYPFTVSSSPFLILSNESAASFLRQACKRLRDSTYETKNKRLVSFGLLISLFPHVWKQFPVFF